MFIKDKRAPLEDDGPECAEDAGAPSSPAPVSIALAHPPSMKLPTYVSLFSVPPDGRCLAHCTLAAINFAAWEQDIRTELGIFVVPEVCLLETQAYAVRGRVAA